MNVTKLELCTRVAKKLNKPSVNDLKPVIETFLEEILTVMAEGYRIEIRGFGCFQPIVRKRRVGRNPRTGEVVDIPACTTPCFKFSREAQTVFDQKVSSMKHSKVPKPEIIPSDKIMTAVG
jgi:integration host factor subunit beta